MKSTVATDSSFARTQMPDGLFALVLGIICALWAVYAGVFVWNSSVVVDQQRWFWLFDDAMISMRYAWNLAHGHGLTWNAGLPPVEGFTNPLWTLMMAGLHLLPHSAATISLYVQIVSAVMCLGVITGTAMLGRKLGAGDGPVLTASAMVAFFYPLNFYSLLGMETAAQALLLLGACILIVSQLRLDRAGPAPWVVLGVAAFLRLDSYACAGFLLMIAVWLSSPGQRRRHFTYGLTAILATLALQTALRLWYYGELLPNTYYLKMTGQPLPGRVLRGFMVTSRSVFNVSWPVYIVLPFVYVWYTRHRAESRLAFRRFGRSPWLLPVGAVISQVAYSTWVGGDAWENEIYANRFLVVAAPMAFLLMTQGLWMVLERVWRVKPSPAVTVSAIVFAAPLLVFQTNYHPGTYRWAWQQATLRVPAKDADIAVDSVRYAHHLRIILPFDTLIIAERAGTIPYFLPGYRFHDPLGKTDPIIARQDTHYPGLWNTSFTPGHNKWDCQYSLERPGKNIAVLPGAILNGYCQRELGAYRDATPPDAVVKLYLAQEK